MSLALRDANTIDLSNEFSNVQFPNGVVVQQEDRIDFRVTFARSGPVTMRPNPAWFVNGHECYYIPYTSDHRVQGDYNMQFLIGAVGEISANNYEAVNNSYRFEPSNSFLYNSCDAETWAASPGPKSPRTSADFQVAAGAEWQFRVLIYHWGQGVMVGRGTAMTIHFEPAR